MDLRFQVCNRLNIYNHCSSYQLTTNTSSPLLFNQNPIIPHWESVSLVVEERQEMLTFSVHVNVFSFSPKDR